MTLPRAIETRGYAKLKVPNTFGNVPRLEWLSISQLVVDPEYQREISYVGRKNIRHIAEHFNWSMFGTVMVAAIGGSQFAIVDGQHRATAAALCGIEKVPCQIVDALRGEQAAAFRAINGNTTRPHTIQLFHASVGHRRRKGSAAGRPGLQPRRHPHRAFARTVPRSRDVLGRRHPQGHRTPWRGNRRTRSADAVIEVLASHPDWQKKLPALKLAFEEMTLEDMWRQSTAQAARVKGTSGMDILQREMTKIIAKKMPVAE